MGEACPLSVTAHLHQGAEFPSWWLWWRGRGSSLWSSLPVGVFSTECWSPELNAFQNPSLDKCSLRALKTISTPWDMFQGFLMIWCLGHTQTLHGAGMWVLSGLNVWAMRKVEPTAAQASFLSSLLPFLSSLGNNLVPYFLDALPISSCSPFHWPYGPEPLAGG